MNRIVRDETSSAGRPGWSRHGCRFDVRRSSDYLHIVWPAFGPREAQLGDPSVAGREVEEGEPERGQCHEDEGGDAGGSGRVGAVRVHEASVLVGSMPRR